MPQQPNDLYVQTNKRKGWLVRLAKLKHVKLTGSFILQSELVRLCGFASVEEAREAYLSIRSKRRSATRSKKRRGPEPGVCIVTSESRAKASRNAYLASDEFLTSFEWRQLRMQALKKYGPVCMCCGASPQTGAVVNVDHVKPRKLFPELALVLDNLQILCHECNHGKGNWDQTDWRPDEFDAEQVAHLRMINTHG